MVTTQQHRNEEQHRRLALVGLVLAFLVGPVGAGIGAWLARRARREGSPIPGLAVAAITVGALQTALVAALVIPPQHSPSSPSGPLAPASSSPAPSWTYPTWQPPTEEPTIVEPTPARPLPTAFDSYAPASVGPYEAGDTTPDPEVIDKGAQSAEQGTYSDSKHTVQTVTAEWPTTEDARAYVREEATATFGTEPARVTGPIPSGEMWYYLKDGKATLYAYQGRFTIVVTGEPGPVQQFFSQFPA